MGEIEKKHLQIAASIQAQWMQEFPPLCFNLCLPGLRDRGLFDSVIPMLLKAKKSFSFKVFRGTLKAYFALCEARKLHSNKYSLRWFLFFTLTVLPSLCLAPVLPKEIWLHCLDLSRAAHIYLQGTSSSRKTDSLFVISEGPHNGQPASLSIISGSPDHYTNL